MSTTSTETGVTTTQCATAPVGMLAELTHRCPLQCSYCSNPIHLESPQNELSTAEWLDVLDQAADLGVLHIHLSGGEPTLRPDLPSIVERAAKLGLYTNLITAAVTLTRESLATLVSAGLDHVQISVQGASAKAADRIAGIKRGHVRKLEVAGWVRELGVALTINAPVHRQNLDSLGAIILLAEELGAGRVEVAHVQYYGWALLNRAQLMPTREQVQRSIALVESERQRLKGRMVIDFVAPDYFAARPKPCMGGWGRGSLNVTPTGRVLPCHAAETIPDLVFDNVRDRPLRDIWLNSAAFARFRGTAWMPEPCRSCERKEIDWGGCRCQALALTGDAAATDPVCDKSPMHDRVRLLAETDAQVQSGAVVARNYRESRLRDG